MKFKLSVLILIFSFIFAFQYILGEELISYEEEPIVINEFGIINTVVPSNMDFKMDPANVSGRGQVYSDVFEIYNESNSDILFTFTDVAIECTDGIELSPSDGEWRKVFSEARKIIWIGLKFGHETVETISLTDTAVPLMTMPITIASGSALTFELTGSMSSYPADEWRDEDIKVWLNYKIEAAELQSEAQLDMAPWIDDELQHNYETIEPELGTPPDDDELQHNDVTTEPDNTDADIEPELGTPPDDDELQHNDVTTEPDNEADLPTPIPDEPGSEIISGSALAY